MKNSIFRKSSYVNSNFKKKKLEFEFHVKFLTLHDFLKIEFQNRGILLNNFITNGILLHFLGERDKCSFWPQNVVT